MAADILEEGEAQVGVSPGMMGGVPVTAMTAHLVNNHVILISEVIMRC